MNELKETLDLINRCFESQEKLNHKFNDSLSHLNTRLHILESEVKELKIKFNAKF